MRPSKREIEPKKNEASVVSHETRYKHRPTEDQCVVTLIAQQKEYYCTGCLARFASTMSTMTTEAYNTALHQRRKTVPKSQNTTNDPSSAKHTRRHKATILPVFHDEDDKTKDRASDSFEDSWWNDFIMVMSLSPWMKIIVRPRSPRECACFSVKALAVVMLAIFGTVFALSFLGIHQPSHLLPSRRFHHPQHHHHHNFHNQQPYPRAPGSRNDDGGVPLKTYPKASAMRTDFERLHDPNDLLRIQKAVHDMRVSLNLVNDNDNDAPGQPYTKDLQNCPRDPAELMDQSSYPQLWSLVDILKDWNPNNVNIPTNLHFHSLCVLDWKQPHAPEQVEAYRKAEIPFVLDNHPEWLRTAERWNHNVDDDHADTSGAADSKPYIVHLLDEIGPQRNEFRAHSNHLSFWRRQRGQDYSGQPPPPTENVELTIHEWWRHKTALEEALEHNTTTVPESDHYYFRLNAQLGVMDFLYQELPLFDPNAGSSTFMVDPSAQRGINCRFGMVGSIADSHFDPTRNWIVNLGGLRRYILSPPSECPHLNLWPMDHQSARHSKIHWADATDEELQTLNKARALQVVLQPGQALYLPTSWFHYIVSLTSTFQCNARSGTTQTHGSDLQKILGECGFPFY